MLEELLITLKQIEFWGNNGYEYAIALVWFIGLIIVLKAFQVLIIVRLRQLAKRTSTDFDDVVIAIISNVKPPLYFLVALYVAINFITLPDLAAQIVKIFFLIAIVYEVIQAVDKLISYGVHRYLAKQSDQDQKEQAESMARVLQIIAKVALWVIGLLMILANLGVNVTSLVASLGIGGLAVALALQNVLSDLISSFSIYMDKPFEIGDFIIVGDHMGTVEKIGLKTTRLTSMKGEELVISNKELTETRIQNFKRMEKRREAFTFGVLYDTSAEQVAAIPGVIQKILEAEDMASYDRCHFSSFGDSALLFDTVYFVATQNYNEFMNVKQKINQQIMKDFAAAGIEFAYPTQTLYIQK